MRPSDNAKATPRENVGRQHRGKTEEQRYPVACRRAVSGGAAAPAPALCDSIMAWRWHDPATVSYMYTDQYETEWHCSASFANVEQKVIVTGRGQDCDDSASAPRPFV